MSLVRLENVRKIYASIDVLDGVDLRLEEGEHVGLIGRNGSGKSTLFRIIKGDVQPDDGVIERMRRARFASLDQLHRIREEQTIHEIVLEAFAELRGLEEELRELEQRIADGDNSILDDYSHKQDLFTLRGGYEYRTRIKQVLGGLGFKEDEHDLPFSVLSGGQRTRLMLALVLLREADLLLLDEPENHLDLEAREWLEAYLRDCPQAVLIISHDRRMLNTVVSRIVEIERGGLTSYTGNYEAFVAAKALQIEQQQAAFERQQEFIRKEEAWIDRFRYKNTKAKAAQSRLKRLEKLETIQAPQGDEAVARFNLGEVVRSGAVVLRAEKLSMAYGDLQLYRNFSMQVERGERVGIIGPNGSGKSTLLRHLAGQHNGLGGEVSLGHKVSMGYYDQNHSNLNVANDVLTEVQQARPDWRPEQVRTFLGKLLFTGDDVFKSIGSLSGGELSRVALAKLMLSDVNLLLMDEPTNHLDILSREALEEALGSFPGSMVVVSHDRALIDRLVEKLLIVEDGRVSVHLGNYSSYRWKTSGGEATPTRDKSTDEVLKIRRQQDSRSARKERQKADKRQQRRLEQLENDIEDVEALIEGFSERFAAVDPADYEAGQRLKEEYEGLQDDLRELYAEWEELAQQQ